ncbi:MAG: heparinase II/III family protein [Candidatus Hydrogenedentes bacterium]|nr:heparinase II/III family protein [Candidatus Hydrogenedentota bacterium]
MALAIVPTCLAFAADTLTAPIPINVAEGIIEAFWDPEISGFDEWSVDDAQAHGLNVFQNWAAVDFQWVSAPVDDPIVCMRKAFEVDCAGYDTLLVKLTAPGGARVRLIADTDTGEHASERGAENGSYEYSLPLEGSSVLRTLCIEVYAGETGPGAGWVEWVALQNASKLDLYHKRWDYSGIDWSRHVVDDSTPLTFQPVYGIFLTAAELADLREEHRQAIATTGESRFTRLAAAAKDMDFERGIAEFAKSGGSDGGRVRDLDRPVLPGGPSLAEAALVLEDRALMVAAARYALSLATSRYWDRDFRSNYPTGPADDRAFRRSYTCEDIAVILDLAGEIFSTAGRRYLMRRLSEEGVGKINYVTWKHEYIHHTNQLAYFNQGRMSAYLVLEREYPRVKPYTDLALADTVGNIENSILPDGGYAEGPGYFSAMARRNYTILKYYARARDVELPDLVPRALRSTSDYAETLASTTPDDVIPVGDSEAHLSDETLEAMVELMPGSYWQILQNKKRHAAGKELLPGKAPAPRPFVALPNLGYIASYRMLDGQPVKLLILGNVSGADHAHEDKGSFVLEFGGEVFAMDLGSTSYSDPVHQLYKHAQRHNMLVPVGTDERPAPPIKLEANVIPIGKGNKKRFEARIDATPGWEPYYERWIRTWSSPEPSTLVIEDDYALCKGAGVSFLWQTTLPCRQDGRKITITGTHGEVILNPPDDCDITIESIPMAGGASQNRIAFTRHEKVGTLRVEIRLQPL